MFQDCPLAGLQRAWVRQFILRTTAAVLGSGWQPKTCGQTCISGFRQHCSSMCVLVQEKTLSTALSRQDWRNGAGEWRGEKNGKGRAYASRHSRGKPATQCVTVPTAATESLPVSCGTLTDKPGASFSTHGSRSLPGARSWLSRSNVNASRTSGI